MKTAKLVLSPLRRAKSRRDGTLLTVCFSLRAILLPALLFFTCANLPAQVTMGGLEEPKTGALLDLNSTVKGGLLLSNVVLDNLYTIPHDNTNLFPGVDSSNFNDADVKTGFAGAMVYHTGTATIPAGIYVWNGTNWTSIEENCAPPTLMLSVPPFVKKDVTVTFSVASDASDRCAEGETYEWFKAATPGGVVNTPFGSAASASTSFAAEGAYKVKVVATSPYSGPVETEVEVNVTADGNPDPLKITHTYGIVGETCLDVKKTDQGKTPDVFDARKDAFEYGYTKEYKFVHGNSYRDLNLSYMDDPTASIVAGITYPSVSADGSGSQTFTVTFNSNVKNLVPASGNSLTVKLYASYKDDNLDTKYAYLEIRVEDGTCICPAKISDTKWLNFMCHNLGGLDIISSSQLVTREHHGDWYRFGVKNVSMKNTSEHDANNTWDNNASYTALGNWPDNYNVYIGNPCPAGWQIPLIDELAAVINMKYSNTTIPEINPLTNVPVSWVASGNQTFCNLKKSGDYLYLPATGYRETNGKLSLRGSNGFYWSSTGHSTTEGRYIGIIGFAFFLDRGYGFSVRCVEKE
jgi:uncharacterized protein (TIGR02145 family)